MGLFKKRKKQSLLTEIRRTIFINGKEKEIILDFAKNTVWIDPEHLDFDGEIIAHTKDYFLADGQSSKELDADSEYAFFNNDKLICCRGINGGIKFSSIDKNGNAYLCTDEDDFFAISTDGKQKNVKLDFKLRTLNLQITFVLHMVGMIVENQ